MNDLITVPFHQQTLLAVEKDGKRWVAMKPICDAIGIDWRSQRKRLLRDEVLASVVVIMTTTGADGKQYEMLFIDIDYLNGWLFGIGANQVKPDLRDLVIAYKRECYKVLAGHYLDKDRRALVKAETKNFKKDKHYFERYPVRRKIHAMALQGEPYWFIGRCVERSAGTVGRAVNDMVRGGYMEHKQLTNARIGLGAWSRYRRKYVNQLTFGF